MLGRWMSRGYLFFLLPLFTLFFHAWFFFVTRPVFLASIGQEFDDLCHSYRYTHFVMYAVKIKGS